MTPDPLSRRDFVGSMAGGIAAVWLAGAFRLPSVLPAGRVLTPEQLRDLDAFASLIIPTDDAPGAREAHVVDFIDRGLASFAADQRALFEQGLADLRLRAQRVRPGAGFADLPVSDQTAVLRSLEAERSEFFEAARVATITGFLADPQYGGNPGKVGWNLIGFEDRFVWQAPFGYYDQDAAAGP
jgi:gluconate 2-dehydrogenase gamma chain